MDRLSKKDQKMINELAESILDICMPHCENIDAYCHVHKCYNELYETAVRLTNFLDKYPKE